MDEALQKKLMDEVDVEKTWQIPAHNGHGPVTITVRVPSVTVTDSEGRYIRVAPHQTELLGAKLGNISDWFTAGSADWVDDDEQ